LRKEIKVLTESNVGDLINVLIERGHLTRLSQNKVEYLCGPQKVTSSNGLSFLSFASISRDYRTPSVKLGNAIHGTIARGYILSDTGYIFLTTKDRSKYVWIKKEEPSPDYLEVDFETVLDNAPDNIVEDLIFNMDLIFKGNE
jgi:hypothetical protein